MILLKSSRLSAKFVLLQLQDGDEVSETGLDVIPPTLLLEETLKVEVAQVQAFYPELIRGPPKSGYCYGSQFSARFPTITPVSPSQTLFD